MVQTALPDHYSLGQLYTNLVEHSGNSACQTLGVLEQCLLHFDSAYREPGYSQDAQKLFSWAAIAIKPVGDILVHDDPKQIEDWVSMSSTAFKCMLHLQTHFLSQEQVDSNALLSIMAYTDVEDPWTLEATQEAAEQVLGYHQKQLKTHEFVVEHVLTGFIRPLFSGSQTTSVTSQGRKAITQAVQKPHHLHNLDESKKPWKFREVYAMAVLRWAIRNMDVRNLIATKTTNSALTEFSGEHISEELAPVHPSTSHPS
jgi:hypothetical protein